MSFGFDEQNLPDSDKNIQTPRTKPFNLPSSWFARPHILLRFSTQRIALNATIICSSTVPHETLICFSTVPHVFACRQRRGDLRQPQSGDGGVDLLLPQRAGRRRRRRCEGGSCLVRTFYSVGALLLQSHAVARSGISGGALFLVSSVTGVLSLVSLISLGLKNSERFR